MFTLLSCVSHTDFKAHSSLGSLGSSPLQVRVLKDPSSLAKDKEPTDPTMVGKKEWVSFKCGQLEYEGEIAFLELMEQHLGASEDVELTRLPFEEELWKKNKETRTSGQGIGIFVHTILSIMISSFHIITITITSTILIINSYQFFDAMQQEI